MNKLFLITVLSIWVGFAAAQTSIAASQSDPVSKKATKFTQIMTVELGLTGEQRESVHCAQLTFLQEKAALMRNHQATGGNSEKPRMKLFELQSERDRKVQAALTRSQIEKYIAFQKSQRSQMGVK